MSGDAQSKFFSRVVTLAIFGAVVVAVAAFVSQGDALAFADLPPA